MDPANSNKQIGNLRCTHCGAIMYSPANSAGCPKMGGLCRGLLAAAAEDDEAEGGAVNNLDSASAAGDSPEVPSLSCLHTPALQVFEAPLLSLVSSGRHRCSVACPWALDIMSGHHQW